MPSTVGPTIVVQATARLLAGRPPHFNDPEFWRDLFRSPSLNIEGRVPIAASESYLLNSRLNSGRELVAVAFSPNHDDTRGQYEELCNGLLMKEQVSFLLLLLFIPLSLFLSLYIFRLVL